MSELQGRRYPDNTAAIKMEPGGYAYQDWTHPPHWQIRDPLGDVGSIRGHHQCEVHDDGSLSVTPSIVGGNGPFHGFLKRGVWTW
jgi:hypothetical protein